MTPLWWSEKKRSFSKAESFLLERKGLLPWTDSLGCALSAASASSPLFAPLRENWANRVALPKKWLTTPPSRPVRTSERKKSYSLLIQSCPLGYSIGAYRSEWCLLQSSVWLCSLPWTDKSEPDHRRRKACQQKSWDPTLKLAKTSDELNSFLRADHSFPNSFSIDLSVWPCSACTPLFCAAGGAGLRLVNPSA